MPIRGDKNSICARSGGRRGRNARGAIALMTVIILGAMLLTVGISVAFMGQSDSIVISREDNGLYVRSLATACAEEAMFRLKLDSAYAGGTVPVGSGDCSVTVSGSGASRVITASATHVGYMKTVSVGVSRRQNVAANARAWNIDSWLEVEP